MPFDRYCVITGWRYMTAEDELIEDISSTLFEANLWESEEEIDPEDYEDYYESEHTYEEVIYKKRRVPSERVRDGLVYTEEDVVATNKYVLVTPCEVNQDGELVVPEDVTEPEVLDETTVTYLFDVWPSDSAEDGIYFRDEGDHEIHYDGVGWSRILVNFCAFLILQHLIPGLKAHVFYELVLATGGPSGRATFPNVDYGPVRRAQEMAMQWGQIADFDSDSDVEEDSDDEMDLSVQKKWLKLLTQEGKSDEEILEDAWMGRGNMWVFKHPGIFPIAETARLAEERPLTQLPTVDADSKGHFEVLTANPLLTLPTELMETVFYYLPPESVLRFISTSTTVYSRFHTRLDKLTYLWIQQERPWYFPVGPIQCKEGDTEIVRWRHYWQEETNLGGGGLANEEEIPWFAYHIACKRSPNMKSRERIWKIVLQIKETLASISVSTVATAVQ